jgi:hypothetical protein
VSSSEQVTSPIAPTTELTRQQLAQAVFYGLVVLHQIRHELGLED